MQGNFAGLVAKLCLSLATLWTVAHQAPLSMGFSREEYWSGLSFPSPRDLPNPAIQPRSPALQADSLPSELPRSTVISHGSQMRQSPLLVTLVAKLYAAKIGSES